MAPLLSACCVQTTLRSRLIIESLGPKRCRQTLQGSIDVRVAGLGKTVEKIIVQQLTKVYQSIPAVIDRLADSSSSMFIIVNVLVALQWMGRHVCCCVTSRAQDAQLQVASIQKACSRTASLQVASSGPP